MANLSEALDEYDKVESDLSYSEKYKNWTFVDYHWVAHELLSPLINTMKNLNEKLSTSVYTSNTLHIQLLNELYKFEIGEKEINSLMEIPWQDDNDKFSKLKPKDENLDDDSKLPF